MRECKLAGGKNADDIQINQIAKILDRKLIDRFVRRVPTRIVNEAINPAVMIDCLRDQFFDLIHTSNIGSDEAGLSFPDRIELGSALPRFLLATVTDNDDCTRSED